MMSLAIKSGRGIWMMMTTSFQMKTMLTTVLTAEWKQATSSAHKGNQARPAQSGRARKEMIRVDDQDIIFVLTKEDIIECAKEMDIPEEVITDDVLRQVRKGVDSGLECWSDVVKDAISYALKS